MTPTPLPDDSVFLEALRGLLALYYEFPLESRIWERHGPRRSPYRALVLFGLSPRTRDHLLVDMCRRFFARFPTAGSLAEGWPNGVETVRAIVRKGQVPLVRSAALAIQQGKGEVPSHMEALLAISGVGEKVAECVLAYGWGQEALPVDGNVCRVAGRLYGLRLDRRRDYAPCFRRQLKEMYNARRGWMAARGIAMIDIHELLRLHGQVVCTETPKCCRCPIPRCGARQARYTGPGRPPVSATFWREWRDLLLDPAGVERAGTTTIETTSV